MKKILVIGLGGTIGAKTQEKITLSNPLKILDMYNRDDVIFDSASPFSLFSENADFQFYKTLVNYLSGIDFAEYIGVIILHGSDTLTWSGAIISNLFTDKNIVLVASDKPLDDKRSNGLKNFDMAVNHLMSKRDKGVFTSWNGIKKSYALTSINANDDFIEADVSFSPLKTPSLKEKNIVIIYPYPTIDYNNINISNADVVLHAMYHSSTVSEKVDILINKCNDKNIPLYFVTTKENAPYETTKDRYNIIYSSTVENAFSKILLDN